MDPRVVEAMLPYLTTHFGNPSGGHHYAEQPHRALATARQQVARLIGAAPDEIVFTGTGSEADALAIHGTVHSQEPSPVLLAMPRHRGQALSALRLSLGRWTTQPDVERAAKAIAMTAHRLFTPTATP